MKRKIRLGIIGYSLIGLIGLDYRAKRFLEKKRSARE
jgi:hypothetical protein